MRNRLFRNALVGGFAVLSAGVLAVGCSSSSSSSTPTEAGTGSGSSFSGIYVTNSVGGIQQFEFVDESHVNVWWASCADGKPCEANDTYTKNGEDLVISEAGGNTTKIILSGIQSGLGTAYDPLHPLGGVSLTGGSGDSGTSLTVAETDGGLTIKATVNLIFSFTITIVIGNGDGGVALVGGDAGKEGGAGEGGVKLTSDGAVSLLGDGAAVGEGGASSSAGSSGAGSSGASSGGTGSSGAGGSDAGSSSASSSSSSSTASSSSASSSSSSSQEMICSTVTSQTFTKASTFPNDKTAFDFLLSEGLTATQAAGVIGNLDQESGDSPTCYQGPNGCSSSPVSGYPGAGIAQWSRGARWDTTSNDNEKSYASQNGESTSALQTQLGFIWYELSNISHYGLASLKEQTTITGAAQTFASDFEACGKCDQTNRIKYGQNAYSAFSGDQVQPAADAGACVQTYGSCTANGSSGSCIDTGACSTRGGTSSSGHCPGPSNIQCCTE